MHQRTSKKTLGLWLILVVGCTNPAVTPLGQARAALSSDLATQPLRVWASPSTGDVFATTVADLQLANNYVEQEPLGYINSPEDPGEHLLPLVSWYSDALQDHLTTTDPEWAQGTTHDLYVFVRVEGYVFADDPGGAVRLLRWFNPQTSHNLLLTEAQQPPPGYQPLHDEGFIRPWVDAPSLAPPMVSVVGMPNQQINVVAGSSLTLPVTIERRELDPQEQQLYGFDRYDGEVVIQAKAFARTADPGEAIFESEDIRGTAFIPAGQTSGEITIDVSSLSEENLYDITFGGYFTVINHPTGLDELSVIDIATMPLSVFRFCFDSCPPLKPRKMAVTWINPIAATISAIVGNNTPRETSVELEQRTATGPWTLVSSGPPSPKPNEAYILSASGLTPSTLYCFRFKVTNPIGTTYSNEACATTAAAPPPPVAPKLSVSVASCDPRVQVTFSTRNDLPATYDLYRGPTLLKTFIPGVTGEPTYTKQSYVDGSTVVGGEYSYTLKATHLGSSSWSDAATIKVPPCVPPPPPPPATVNFVFSPWIMQFSSYDKLGMPTYYGEAFHAFTTVCNYGGLDTPKYKNRWQQSDYYSPYYLVEDQTFDMPVLNAGKCYSFNMNYWSGVVANLYVSGTRRFTLTVSSDNPKNMKTLSGSLTFSF